MEYFKQPGSGYKKRSFSQFGDDLDLQLGISLLPFSLRYQRVYQITPLNHKIGIRQALKHVPFSKEHMCYLIPLID